LFSLSEPAEEGYACGLKKPPVLAEGF